MAMRYQEHPESIVGGFIASVNPSV